CTAIAYTKSSAPGLKASAVGCAPAFDAKHATTSPAQTPTRNHAQCRDALRLAFVNAETSPLARCMADVSSEITRDGSQRGEGASTSPRPFCLRGRLRYVVVEPRRHAVKQACRHADPRQNLVSLLNHRKNIYRRQNKGSVDDATSRASQVTPKAPS